MSADQKHTYKLYYIDGRGRAEPIRLIFRYFNVDFEDYRMAYEDVPAEKMKAPMKQLPFMEMDGGRTVLCQTVSICRYLGKSLHHDRWFGGATKTESARIDMFADSFSDIFDMAMGAAYADERIKDVMMENVMKVLPNRLETLQSLLAENGGKYFVGKKVHWCDVYALAVLGALDENYDGIFDDLPGIRNYYIRMRNLPELKSYIQEYWPATKYEQSKRFKNAYELQSECSEHDLSLYLSTRFD